MLINFLLQHFLQNCTVTRGRDLIETKFRELQEAVSYRSISCQARQRENKDGVSLEGGAVPLQGSAGRKIFLINLTRRKISNLELFHSVVKMVVTE